MTQALLFDLSGVLYDGDEVIPGAQEAVARAQDSGLAVRFITNTSQKTRAQLLAHLEALGLPVQPEQLFTAVDAACDWLRARDLRPFCLVHRHIVDEFAEFEQSQPNAVLITDAAEDFSYANLNRAFQLCVEGAPLLGVGYNRYFRCGDELLLDAGAFIRAIEFAADTEATIVGKPSRDFFRLVLDSIGVAPADAVMIGDDVFGDVEGALGAGVSACLVKTGKYREGDEDRVSGNFALADSVVGAVQQALEGTGGESAGTTGSR